MMSNKNSPVKLEIQILGDYGDGLAKLESGERVYVDGALPGEVVTAQIHKGKDGSLRAAVDKVEVHAPERQTPPCKHYQQCGGCQMQHVNETTYRAWKEDKLLHQMNVRLGDGTKPQIIPAIYIPEGTRRRVSFSAIKQGKKMMIGYKQRRTNYIASIDECLLLTPQLNQLLQALKKYLPDMLADRRAVDVMLQQSGNIADCLITGPLQMAGKKGRDLSFAVRDCAGQIVQETHIARISWRFNERETPEILVQQESLYKDMGKFKPTLAAGAFLQPSSEGEKSLVNAVINALPDKAQRVADLFAGYGTFTGRLADKGLGVDAYEGETVAATAMQKAGHGHAYARDLFQQPLKEKELKVYDAVILDPPRAGAQKQCENLAKSIVPRIIYVSCSPNSFFKDAEHLIEKGGYTLTSLQMIDQFRWSTHVEVIGVFDKV